MGIRRLAALFVLLALVAKLVSPCEASVAVALGAPDAAIAKCHLLAKAPMAQGESKQAPSDDLDRDGCSCALCQIGWSTLPPADNFFAIRSLAYLSVSRTPPTQAFVASQPNRGARPRGPPSFV